jgi:hypothetical protein
MYNYWMLKHVVYIATTELYRVNIRKMLGEAVVIRIMSSFGRLCNNILPLSDVLYFHSFFNTNKWEAEM